MKKVIYETIYESDYTTTLRYDEVKVINRETRRGRKSLI